MSSIPHPAASGTSQAVSVPQNLPRLPSLHLLYPDHTRYDGAGNRLTEEETVPAACGGVRVVKQRTFAYDGRNRVRFVRDALRGNRSMAYGWNARGDLVSKTVGQLDGDGNVVPGTERQRLTFTWDRAGRLRAVAKAAPGSSPLTVAEFGYDGSGRRVWKEGKSFLPDVTAVHDLRRYLHDGEAILAELGESPGGGYHPVQRYLHGIGVLARERLDDADVPTRRPDADPVPTRRPGADPVPTRRPGADPESNPTSLQTLFHHADGLGSTVNVTGSDGAVKHAYLYDAWGNARELEAGGACVGAPDLGLDGLVDWNVYLENLTAAFAEDGNRATFTGYEVDPETGWYNAGARVYDPETGRFLTEDGAPGDEGAPVSLHRYLYANANPVRFVDPTGNSSEDTAGVASLTNRTLGEGPGMEAGGAASGGAPAEGLTAEEMAAMSHDVRLSKDNWPLSLSRAAPQYQGTWPPHVGVALEEWIRNIPPDRIDPMTRLTRAYNRTKQWIADEWEDFTADPLRYGFHTAARVAWHGVCVPVGETCISGYEMVTDPSWEHAENLGRNLFNLVPTVGTIASGVRMGKRALTKLGELGGSRWFRGKAPDLPMARPAKSMAGQETSGKFTAGNTGKATEKGLVGQVSRSESSVAVKKTGEQLLKPEASGSGTSDYYHYNEQIANFGQNARLTEFDAVTDIGPVAKSRIVDRGWKEIIEGKAHGSIRDQDTHSSLNIECPFPRG